VVLNHGEHCAGKREPSLSPRSSIVDGTVTGQGQVNNPSFPIRIHFGIDCLKFDGDNRIIASGPIIRSSDPATIAVGRIAVFAVEDNGEGVNAPPDRITTIPDYAPPKELQ
jgi:hypothetical protein